MGRAAAGIPDDMRAIHGRFARWRKSHTGHLGTGAAFIRALADAGTAHRACERSRIRLDKYLAQLQHATS